MKSFVISLLFIVHASSLLAYEDVADYLADRFPFWDNFGFTASLAGGYPRKADISLGIIIGGDNSKRSGLLLEGTRGLDDYGFSFGFGRKYLDDFAGMEAIKITWLKGIKRSIAGRLDDREEAIGIEYETSVIIIMLRAGVFYNTFNDQWFPLIGVGFRL